MGFLILQGDPHHTQEVGVIFSGFLKPEGQSCFCAGSYTRNSLINPVNLERPAVITGQSSFNTALMPVFALQQRCLVLRTDAHLT